MANKKELYSADIHPDAGVRVTISLRNKATGAESKKAGIWNRTHWTLVNKKTGVTSPISADFEIVGWYE